VSGDGPLREKASDSSLIHCFSQAPLDRLARFWVNFELLASPVRLLTHIEFYPGGLMPAALVQGAAVPTVRPRPAFVFFRHRRRNLSREARIEWVF
jgi:hypothetical protein